MSTAGRIVWGISVLAVLIGVVLLVLSWESAGDAWAFLTLARDAIAPFFEGVGDWVSSIRSGQ